MTVDNCGVPSGRFEKAEAGVPSRGCHSERNDRRERSRRIFALTHCTVKTRCEDPSTRFRSLRMTRWVDFVHWPYFSTLDSHCQLSIKNNTIRWMVLLLWGGRWDSLPFAIAKVRCCRCPASDNAHPAGVCDLSFESHRFPNFIKITPSDGWCYFYGVDDGIRTHDLQSHNLTP